MKKTTLLLLTLLLSYATFSQTGGFNYKALLIDNGTALNTQSVTLKFTVLENGITSIYQETQTTTTDANGIVSVNIGEGTVLSGTFSSINWGNNPHFLKVEVDTGSGFADFGTSEFKTVPYAKYADKAGNVFSGNFSDLNGIPTGLADGDDVNDADHSTTNELQTLTFDNSSRQLTITNGNSVTIPAGSSTGGDGWGTQVAATNNSINGDGTSANPLGVNTSDAVFSGWDKNAADDFDGNFTHLTNVPSGLADGDDDTQLTDAQIAAMGYIKNANDADHDATNELQTLNLSGNQLSILNRNTVTFTGWDTDASDDFDGNFTHLTNVPADLADGDDDTQLTDAQISAMGYIKDANDADHSTSNELQTISKNASNVVTLSDGGGSFTDDVLTETQVDNYVSNNGYLTAEVDGSTTNEIQNLSLSSNQLTISDSNTITFTNWDTDATDDVQNLNDLSDAKTRGSSYFIGQDCGNHDAGINFNVGFGKEALQNNSRGKYNTAIGTYALKTNVGFNGAVAIGYGALKNANSATQNLFSYNVAVGYHALMGSETSANNTGTYNVAIGSNTLYYNESGASNAILGHSAFYKNISGNYNVGVGKSAGHRHETGDKNVFIGYKAGFENQSGSRNVFIGYSAGYNETGSGKLYIADSDTATPLIYGDFYNDEVIVNGDFAATGGLWVTKNCSASNGQINLTEEEGNDGARILFKNYYETDNKWTLWGRADNTDGDSYFNIHYSGAGVGNVLSVRGNGKVGIKRTPVTNTLEVNGTASKSTAGSWLANSDRRLKTKINTINPENALQKIRMLRGVTYEWNDNKTGNIRPTGIQYGFIAQEIMEVFPSKVSKDNLGYYQTAYGDYDPLFVQAIKALDKKVKEVEKLQNEVDELKARLDKLEKLIENNK